MVGKKNPTIPPLRQFIIPRKNGIDTVVCLVIPVTSLISHLRFNSPRLERGQCILERNNSAEILQTNLAILGRCDDLLSERKPDVYKSPYLNYWVEKKFDFMDRLVVTKTDPLMCLTEGHDSKTGKESNFVVVTRDSEGLQCYQQHDEIKVDILAPKGDHLKTELKDTKDGKYTVTFTPQCVGQHRAEIQMNGQPLTGSTFAVQVQSQFKPKPAPTAHGPGEFY